MCMPREVETQLLYGADYPMPVARELAGQGAKVVIAMLGAAGCPVHISGRDSSIHVHTFPTQVKDPTGEGDAFCNGFLAGSVLSRDPVDAAQCTTVSVSFVMKAIAALAARQPQKEELQVRFKIGRKSQACAVERHGCVPLSWGSVPVRPQDDATLIR